MLIPKHFRYTNLHKLTSSVRKISIRNFLFRKMLLSEPFKEFSLGEAHWKCRYSKEMPYLNYKADHKTQCSCKMSNKLPKCGCKLHHALQCSHKSTLGTIFFFFFFFPPHFWTTVLRAEQF